MNTVQVDRDSIRGACRILYAPPLLDFPTRYQEVYTDKYDTVHPWLDLAVVQYGVQIDYAPKIIKFTAGEEYIKDNYKFVQDKGILCVTYNNADLSEIRLDFWRLDRLESVVTAPSLALSGPGIIFSSYGESPLVDISQIPGAVYSTVRFSHSSDEAYRLICKVT